MRRQTGTVSPKNTDCFRKMWPEMLLYVDLFLYWRHVQYN